MRRCVHVPGAGPQQTPILPGPHASGSRAAKDEHLLFQPRQQHKRTAPAAKEPLSLGTWASFQLLAQRLPSTTCKNAAFGPLPQGRTMGLSHQHPLGTGAARDLHLVPGGSGPHPAGEGGFPVETRPVTLCVPSSHACERTGGAVLTWWPQGPVELKGKRKDGNRPAASADTAALGLQGAPL